jgi:hypothetical protein
MKAECRRMKCGPNLKIRFHPSSLILHTSSRSPGRSKLAALVLKTRSGASRRREHYLRTPPLFPSGLCSRGEGVITRLCEGRVPRASRGGNIYPAFVAGALFAAVAEPTMRRTCHAEDAGETPARGFSSSWACGAISSTSPCEGDGVGANPTFAHQSVPVAQTHRAPRS